MQGAFYRANTRFSHKNYYQSIDLIKELYATCIVQYHQYKSMPDLMS